MYSEDAYVIGLLYVYIYSNHVQRMVSLDSLRRFHQCVNDNLKNMGISFSPYYGMFKDEQSVYFSSCDELGREYYILRSDFDFEQFKNLFLSSLSSNQLLAIEESKALEILGLIKTEKGIKLKRSILAKKGDFECCANCDYNISPELQECILKENEEYRKMNHDEAIQKIGFCELDESIEVVEKLGFWCENYFSSRMDSKGKVRKKVQ